jgi:hypothetical protein
MESKHDKIGQKNIEKANTIIPYHKIPFVEILSGDHSFIRKSFFYMLNKGRFPYLSSKDDREIEHWVNDLSQIVTLAILEKNISGKLDEIKYPKAYIKHIIRYKSIDENNRLSKCISIDSIQVEDDNEKF